MTGRYSNRLNYRSTEFFYNHRFYDRLTARQHLARLGRKSLSFSKSVELHDKVIGHYLNIKHYQ
ncbi:IS1 family transposase [Escherichia coli]|uniref:IS1 family transposase n=1 Tax=Escherichia coli TaxID=562 RepID=UPI003D671F44